MANTEVSGAKERKDGQDIALMIGAYDPPSLDYSRAISALVSSGMHVWACPLYGDNHVHRRAMASILACETLDASVSFCSVGLDKKISSESDIRLWCEKKYPKTKFKLFFLSTEPQLEGIPVVIGNSAQSGLEPIWIPKHVSCQDGVRVRMESGSDERRNFSPLVWNYIKQHDLYGRKS